MNLDARLKTLEKGSTGSLTAGMTTEEAVLYCGGLPPRDQAECIRRMTDDELEAGIACLQASMAIDQAKQTKRKGRRE